MTFWEACIVHFSKMSNVEHREVIKLFMQEGMNVTEISKQLDDVDKDSAPSYCTVVKWLPEYNSPERAFEGAARMGRSSTITTDEDIEIVERIVMYGRQVSVRRLAYKLVIPKTAVHEIMDNQLDMKKVCTRWLAKLLTPIQCANCVDCCQEPSKSGQLFSFHRNWWRVLDSLLRFSEAAGSQGLQEVRWTNVNSTAPRKISWKDYDDHFLGWRWCFARWNHDQWSFWCINHWTAAFYHCGERTRQS